MTSLITAAFSRVGDCSTQKLFWLITECVTSPKSVCRLSDTEGQIPQGEGSGAKRELGVHYESSAQPEVVSHVPTFTVMVPISPENIVSTI